MGEILFVVFFWGLCDSSMDFYERALIASKTAFPQTWSILMCLIHSCSKFCLAEESSSVDRLESKTRGIWCKVCLETAYTTLRKIILIKAFLNRYSNSGLSIRPASDTFWSS